MHGKPRDIFHIQVRNLQHRVVMHGINEEQAASQAERSTEDLMRFDPDDPIRGEPFFIGNEGTGPAQGLRVTGGHHRLNELYTRFLRNEISGDVEVVVLYEKWSLR